MMSYAFRIREAFQGVWLSQEGTRSYPFFFQAILHARVTSHVARFRPLEGKSKRAMGSAIVVDNKSQDALAQLRDGGPTGASEQTANQDREPDLNVVQEGGCAWACRRSACDGSSQRERRLASSSRSDGRFCEFSPRSS